MSVTEENLSKEIPLAHFKGIKRDVETRHKIRERTIFYIEDYTEFLVIF